MGSWTRRDALSGLAVLGGSWLTGCTGGAPVVPPDKVFKMPACMHDAIVESLLNDATTDALPVLQKWLVEKTPTDTLFSAALTIGARVTVVEFDMHAALVVNAAYLMAKRVSPDLQLHPLFYAWDRQYRELARIRGSLPPPLPDIDSTKVPPTADAETKLRAALDAYDPEASEAAVVSLYASGGRAAVLPILTRYGQRNQNAEGHKAIWTAYAIRCMDSLGWDCAPWILRSLVRAYCAKKLNKSTSAFEANLLRLSEVPATFRDGADDSAAVAPLLEVFRVGDAKACVDAVLARLSAGTNRRTIWTALAVAAVELGVRHQETSQSPHELDTVNALRNLQSLSPDPELEKLTLLQAAAWHPEFRANVKTSPKITENLDAITPTSGAVPTLADCLAMLAVDKIEATRKLAAYFKGGGTVEPVIDAYSALIVKQASGDEHHYKYNLALFEEVEAALPEWRSALILGITLRGPDPLDAKWKRYDASQAIIAAL
jgi:hypothetical protein